jgi:hypothetical protein
LPSQIAVNISAVADHRNVYRFVKIINRVNHTIIADAHSPEPFVAVKLGDAIGRGLSDNSSILARIRADLPLERRSNSLRAERAIVTK